MRFIHIILITFTYLLMGCDGSYESNKDEMVTELKTYDNDTSSCPSSGCMFVAVGSDGTILTPQMASWTSNLELLQVFRESHMQIVPLTVGGGKILNSSDGTSWIKGHMESQILAITYGNNTFVVVGCWVYHDSSDGDPWTKNKFLNNIFGVTFSNSKFVAVICGGTNNHTTSSDGTWSEEQVGHFDYLRGIMLGIFVGGDSDHTYLF